MIHYGNAKFVNFAVLNLEKQIWYEDPITINNVISLQNKLYDELGLVNFILETPLKDISTEEKWKLSFSKINAPNVSK